MYGATTAKTRSPRSTTSPPEPVSGISAILEAMGTLPAFRDARRWVLQSLNVAPGGSIFEGRCGTATSLGDVLDIVGSAGHVVGVDPTRAFVDEARQRAV
jgi:SAM-dependent methyltransferase